LGSPKHSACRRTRRNTHPQPCCRSPSGPWIAFAKPIRTCWHVDQVKREIEELKTLGGEGDLEWFGWLFDQGFMPWDEEMRQIELFAEHIIQPSAERRALAQVRRMDWTAVDRLAALMLF
jgi:hypothetical protein